MSLALDIVTHVPLLAWALVALGLYLGIGATRHRTISLATSTILPLVFLGMTASTLIALGPRFPLAAAAWALAFIIGALLGWKLLAPAPIAIERGMGRLEVRGTRAILCIFIVAAVSRFSLGILQAYRAPLASDPAFLALVLAAFGLCAGAIVGRTVRLYVWYFDPAQKRS